MCTIKTLQLIQSRNSLFNPLYLFFYLFMFLFMDVSIFYADKYMRFYYNPTDVNALDYRVS